jgi:TPR repeat protein
VICLEPLKESTSCTLPCTHSFHGKCSNLRSQSTSRVCPLCRTDLPPGPEQACIKLFHAVVNKTSQNESADMCEAVRLGDCAAEEGDIHAQAFLGYCFKEGFGVSQDKARAFYWCMKAAEQGDVQAQYNVGCLYHEGDGVKQDAAKAFEWCLKVQNKEMFKLCVMLAVVIIGVMESSKIKQKLFNVIRRPQNKEMKKLCFVLHVVMLRVMESSKTKQMHFIGR